MKRSLMAAAVAAALGVPGMAAAQNTNVQLYGALDISWSHMNYSGATAGVADISKDHLRGGAPRWGLRGTENLGGGLQAYFQLEAGIGLDGRPNPDQSSSGLYALGGRDSFLGLRSRSWGSIQGGGFGTPYKTSSRFWSVVPSFGHAGIIMNNRDSTGTMPSPNCTNLISPGTGLVAATGGGAGAQRVCIGPAEGNTSTFSRRLAQQIQYQTPNLNGFVGKISVALDRYEATSAAQVVPNAHPKLYSMSLGWTGGPFTIGGAYENHKGFGGAGAISAATKDVKDDGFLIGGKWNFGAGQVGLAWETLKYGATNAAGNNNYKLTNWVINVAWKVSQAGTIGAGYSKTDGRKSCGAGAAGCGSPTSAKVISLSYDHRLSKRTAIYAAYGKIDNGSAATYYYIAGPAGNNNGGVTGGVLAGTDVNTYQIGVKHSF